MNGPHRLFSNATMDCDVLIIGSGAGGSCVADVLTKAGLSVVMLEEGSYIDASLVRSDLTSALPQLWRCGGITATLGNSPVNYAEGRCVGGGTEINSAIFQKTSDELLSTWQQRYQIQDGKPEQLEPYYARAAQLVAASPANVNGASSRILAEGASKLGYQYTLLDRAVKTHTITDPESHNGAAPVRQSMSVTLIPQALKRGMRLIAQCTAKKFVFKKNRIEQVVAIARDVNNQSYQVKIFPKTVFLCAGAIHTPALLLKNGIKKNIGKSLRLHPTIKCTAIFEDKISAADHPLPGYAVTQFMPDLRLGGSVFTLGTYAMALAEDWSNRHQLIPDWQHAGIYYAMVRGEGRGSIHPLPGIREPLVRYRFIDEWPKLALGLQRLVEVMFAAGAKKVYPSIVGNTGWTTLAECKKFLEKGLTPSKTNLMTIHLMGSCPLGENEALTATDSFGRVRGIKNLIIADASQIPEAPGVNPQGTIMAIALRHAESFLNGYL